MSIQAHVPVRGADEYVVRPTGDLEVALGLESGGGAVVGDLVGANNVAAVVDDDVAGQGVSITGQVLAGGLNLDRNACVCGRLGYGNG
jgi:hypothetical protein